MEKTIQGTDEFWRAHILRSLDFPGTNKEYCEQNGLNRKSFSVHKGRLGFVEKPRPRKRRRQLVRVQTRNLEKITLPKESFRRVLPDPKWVAQLILSVLASRR